MSILRTAVAATLCVLTALTAGCETREEIQAKEIIAAEKAEQRRLADNAKSAAHAATAVGKVGYVKDARTGLCFAYMWEGHDEGYQYGIGGPALAQVPCSPEVEKLLVPQTTHH